MICPRTPWSDWYTMECVCQLVFFGTGTERGTVPRHTPSTVEILYNPPVENMQPIDP